MVNNYIPQKGDICYVNFNPTKGHEQKGTRPALVLSDAEFNNFTKLAIIAPITSTIRNFPLHYVLKYTNKIKGEVLCEHLRSVDYNARKLTLVEKLNKDELTEVLDIISGFFE